MPTHESASSPSEDTTVSIPRVFISYSWTSTEYVEKVRLFAERLQGDLVNIVVVLDQWDLQPGQNKYKYMEQMVTDQNVKKVLALCDKQYMEKANSREGGVGTESTIISKEVYEQVNQEKFIPILMEKAPKGEKPYLPVFFGSTMYIDLSNPEQFEARYEDLIRNIYGQPKHVKPPLGKKPSFLK